MAKTGLGRGLDVLLGAPASAAVAPTTEIELDGIAPNPQQPRTTFPEEPLSELASSIRRHGVLQPIVVSRHGTGYELVAGHRRVLASRMAGLSAIPAVVREEVSDRLELALVENIQRADLNAVELARAYRVLMETYDLTQEQLADRVGKSRSTVANTLRALNAPQALQDALVEGRISEGHLRALIMLPFSEALRAFGEVLSRGLSVRATEALARKMVHPIGHGRSRLRGGDPDIAHLAAELRTALGTKVEVLRGRKGGRIVLSFYSDDDFQRLYELLVGAGRS
ncbi:MAG: ParB/RepB/Spo0J family partition protein [Chloroflexota bacterium]|nr:ParB/RepB/Spo0J family partition protein [Chloroflexota bacterium]